LDQKGAQVLNWGTNYAILESGKKLVLTLNYGRRKHKGIYKAATEACHMKNGPSYPKNTDKERYVMAIITISRQYASNGNDIAEKICESTGYYLFDKRIIAETAVDVGLSDEEIVDFSEENYKIKGFFDRLFGGSHLHVWKEMEDGGRTSEEVHLSEENALILVRRAIENAYKKGDTVIVGRGGQVILQDAPDVLHVRVETPLEERIQRVRSHPKLANRSFIGPLEARRAALDLIEESDSASADYLKRFHGVDWSDPMLYHIVVNTGKLKVEQAVRLIIETARQLEKDASYAFA
jgi:cytidylate kinase